MELLIKDRIFFARLLPECKNFLEFNLKRNILKKIEITEADKEKYEITQNNETGTIKWNPKTDSENPLVVDFSADELALIKRGIESIDGQPLPDELWQTAEKVWDAASK